MPKPPERLAALQKRFADHIRDPDGRPAPDGIEDRRLGIYRRLFFNNLSNLFGRNFPVARKTLPNERWRELIRAFMVEHRATTPLFPEIGREFVRFLAEHPDRYREWPWLAEVCHWQFMATCTRNDEAEPADVEADVDGDLLADAPVLNPTLRLARYEWPVHAIDADRPPAAAETVLLAIFRRPDDRLGRLRINAMTARLLELLQENPARPGHECLDALAAESGHDDVKALHAHGARLLASLRDKALLLGTRPAGHARA
jgi:hypothetical protein